MFPLVSCYLSVIPGKRSWYFVTVFIVAVKHSEVIFGLRHRWSCGCAAKGLIQWL